MPRIDTDSINAKNARNLSHYGRPSRLDSIRLQNRRHVIRVNLIDINLSLHVPHSSKVNTFRRDFEDFVVFSFVLHEECSGEALDFVDHDGLTDALDERKHKDFLCLSRELKF